MSRPTLTPRHQQTLIASAIHPDVAHERPYTSVTVDDPRLKGFADYQRADGILIAVCPPDRSNHQYELRRDHDRIATDRETSKRRKIKYEMPAGSKHRLDVHPRNHQWLRDTAKPGWVCEGRKKGDALTSAGQFAVSIGGVDCFRTPECLADWELIELCGRTMIIAYDSDVRTNPNVAKARDRLGAVLAERGARVRVVNLPDGTDGAKLGVDDYLGQGGTIVDLLAKYTEPWHAPTEGDCPRDDCHAVRRELAGREARDRAEAVVLAGRAVPANRIGPALTLLRRVHSDQTRSVHPTAEPGRPETWEASEPLTDPDGWARISLQSWAKFDLGHSYSTMLNTRKELVTAGVLEDREDYERQADGTLIKRTLIRPAGGQSYTESVGKLATVVKPKSNWGGSRWACPKNPDHKIMTKHVCTTCHVDAELVSVPEPPTPHFQVENRPAGSSGAAGTAEAQIRALIDRARHRRPSVSDFQVENGLRDPTAVEVHTQSHGAELGSPAPYFEVENRGCDASSLPPSSPRTYSVETQNSPPDARPADEDGPPNTNGKDTEQAAAKAWGRAALEAAAKLGYPTLMGADGRTRLVKDGQWQWEAVCRAAPPPTIELIAERIGAALERAEREDPF